MAFEFLVDQFVGIIGTGYFLAFPTFFMQKYTKGMSPLAFTNTNIDPTTDGSLEDLVPVASPQGTSSSSALPLLAIQRRVSSMLHKVSGWSGIFFNS